MKTIAILVLVMFCAACGPVGGCNADADCGSGNVCLDNGTCAQNCSGNASNGQCPSGKTCQTATDISSKGCLGAACNNGLVDACQ